MRQRKAFLTGTGGEHYLFSFRRKIMKTRLNQRGKAHGRKIGFGDGPAGIPPLPAISIMLTRMVLQSGGLPTVSVIFRRGDFYFCTIFIRGRCEGRREDEKCFVGRLGVWVSASTLPPPQTVTTKPTSFLIFTG